MELKKILKYLLIMGLALFFIHETIIVLDGLIDDDIEQSDVIVVFGSKVNEDGSLSERLEARLNKAYELYNVHRSNKIFVSGGMGKEGYSEGDVMCAYLVSIGVDSSDIIVDNRGNTTRLTALNFKSHFSVETSIIVVSQYFHITRCKLAFEQLGFENVKGSHASFFEIRDFYSAFREFFGFYKYYFMYS